MNSVSVVIPTLRRPEHLQLCLGSLTAQSRPVREVLVGVRADDDESRTIVAEYAQRMPVRAVEVKGVGVIGSMASCTAASIGDLVALVDDDVELSPEWIERCVAFFENDPKIGGVGGRDLLQDMPEMRRTQPLRSKVGIFTWYGRIHGNHHRGTGPARYVHGLKGCACMYQGDLLREVGFDKRLRGKGAQVGWELSLAFDVMRRGKRLLYDPALTVTHWVAPRHDADKLHRGGFDATALEALTYNENLVFQTKAPWPLRWSHAAWGQLWGNPLAPGWVRATWLRMKGDKTALLRSSINLRTLLEVWREPHQATTSIHDQAS